MTGLLICAAVAAVMGWAASVAGGSLYLHPTYCRSLISLGLALIAAALYLAWRAGGAV